MITQINSAAEGWWSWMWPMFWQVSVLIVFIAAIDFLLRRRIWPQVRYVRGASENRQAAYAGRRRMG